MTNIYQKGSIADWNEGTTVHSKITELCIVQPDSMLSFSVGQSRPGFILKLCVEMVQPSASHRKEGPFQANQWFGRNCQCDVTSYINCKWNCAKKGQQFSRYFGPGLSPRRVGLPYKKVGDGNPRGHPWGVNQWFWCHLRCSGQTTTVFKLSNCVFGCTRLL